jgi:hypothetical protein
VPIEECLLEEKRQIILSGIRSIICKGFGRAR